MRWVIGLLLVVVAWCSAPLAHAESDVIRDWDAQYQVQPDGTIDVTTTLDWDFGEAGRRGIIHNLVIREPWENDGSKDVVYEITDVAVDSPTGAPDQFTVNERREGEFEVLRIQIGDPNETLTESRHTYVISYTLDGAMRTFHDRPELYWDLNSADDVPIDQVSVTVTGPEGVEEARCLVGSSECTSSVTDGEATYSASNVTGDIMSIVAGFPTGSVANAEPTLVDATNGPGTPPSVVGFFGPILGIMLGVGALRLLITWLLRPRPKHQRWAGVAPGVMNPGGPVTTAKPEAPAPVRFEPPDADLTTAGRALHIGYKPSHLAANLVQMAVQGSLAIDTTPLTVTKADPSRIGSATEEQLFRLSDPPQSASALDNKQALNMTKAVQAAAPSGDAAVTTKTESKSRAGWCLILAFVVTFAAIGLPIVLRTVEVPSWLSNPFTSLFAWLPLLFAALSAFYSASILSVFFSRWLRNRRIQESLTPRGSAIKAQAEGFRQYLATAEAHQLNFEADRDIYRRFLPWAVLFDLTDRWTKIGQQLLDEGRLTPADVSFLHDARDIHTMGALIHALERQSNAASDAQFAAQRAAERRSSGSFGGGSGGSSGFSSSSFGGGGGGGSSSSSW